MEKLLAGAKLERVDSKGALELGERKRQVVWPCSFPKYARWQITVSLPAKVYDSIQYVEQAPLFAHGPFKTLLTRGGRPEHHDTSYAKPGKKMKP